MAARTGTTKKRAEICAMVGWPPSKEPTLQNISREAGVSYFRDLTNGWHVDPGEPRASSPGSDDDQSAAA